MLYLSQMIGEPVVDAQGERLGTISDLAISTGEVFPRITSLAFQGPGRVPFMISWRKYVDTFDEDGITLNAEAHDIRFSYLQPDEVLLARDLLNRQIVPVRKDEEAFFHVGPDALLIYIQRLRTADGQPVFLENLFLPYEPYKSLMSENLNDVSMFDTIERISGLRPATTSCQRIEAVRASAEQAQLLNLSLGEPLLYLNAYFHDQYDHPLCIGRQYYIGSRYMFEF